MSARQPRIAIVGAGPGGLVLSQLLHKHRVPFTLFEYRQKLTPEELSQPSGMLDLHEGSGLDAIKECGLWDQFMPLTGECSQLNVVSDKQGNILFDEQENKDETGESDAARPEISRNNLTDLLMRDLPDANIRWGHKLLSATPTANPSSPGHSEIELDFGSYGKQTFDLVIGADGAWSKVRNILTEVRPEYAGLQIITVTIKHITDKYPHLAKMIGSGTYTALGDKKAVVSQRGPLDSSRIYVFMSTDKELAAAPGLAEADHITAKAMILSNPALLGGWGAPVQELVATALDEEAAAAGPSGGKLDIRPLHLLPYGTTWNHRADATLIGDAAHLMPPNGEGVNLAMWDGMLLSYAIVKAYQTAGSGENAAAAFQDTVGPLIKDYETGVAERAAQTAEDTKELLGMMFSDDAAHTFAQFFTTMGQAQPEN